MFACVNQLVDCVCLRGLLGDILQTPKWMNIPTIGLVPGPTASGPNEVIQQLTSARALLTLAVSKPPFRLRIISLDLGSG